MSKLSTAPERCGYVQIIHTFFALIFGTILFSMLVGLCFLPVAFSIIGPARIGGDAASKATSDLPLAAPPSETELTKMEHIKGTG